MYSYLFVSVRNKNLFFLCILIFELKVTLVLYCRGICTTGLFDMGSLGKEESGTVRDGNGLSQ